MNLVIVPVVAGVDMTRRCINSLLAQDIETSVFVVDNGSRDGCGSLLRSYGSRISRIAHMQTVSLNQVWNEALGMAFDSLKLDYAWVVNNDCVFRPDTFRLMLADGGGFVTGVGVDRLTDEPVDPASRSPHPCFSSFLIRKSVWERVGKFDEDYWAYCSDACYHLRMEKAGINAYAIGLPFLHVGSGTLLELRETDYPRHVEFCKRADADRETFKRKYGFAVGSDEYYNQFSKRAGKPYQERGVL